MKIIFLDIDGVLVKCGRYDQATIDENKCNGNYGSVYDTFNQSCVDAFKELLAWDPGIKIVISSSWRSDMGSVRDAFYKADLDWNRVIGSTPGGHDGCREQQIAEWLNNHNANCKWGHVVQKWVAIDDEQSDMQVIKVCGRLVKTQMEEGLTMDDVRRAINQLL